MKIAFLTSGGNAPCLNSSIGRLLFKFSQISKNSSSQISSSSNDISAIGYLNGFSGLLKGKHIDLPLIFNQERQEDLSNLEINPFYKLGGSLIGNSRTKLTNIQDCIKRGFVDEKQIPIEVAARQLIKDNVDILFTIGGDDTNTTAKDLKNYISSKDIKITVIGIPKTIDNDIFPIKRSLGAYTAGSSGASFFSNIVNENFMGERHLIVHEVMGRNSGWLTAFTAKCYLEELDRKNLFDGKVMQCFDKRKYDIHGVYVPEINIDINKEISRLSKLIDDIGCLNLFVSEGAFLSEISKDIKKRGKEVEKDAFGHVRLDTINAAKWYSELISSKINFDRILIQKSGYFARSSAPNSSDLEYIFNMCDFAFENALKFNSGVVGEDERTGELSCIDFNDIRGDKGLDVNSKWFLDIMNRIVN